MSKKIIAVDIDDTIVQNIEAFRIKANEYSNSDLTPEDYKIDGEYWDYHTKVWEQHGLTGKLDAVEIYEDLHSNQSLIPLLPGAEFAINELMKKYQIVLITARDIKWEQATKEWLTEKFGDKAPNLYFSLAHRDSSHKTKGQICKELGAKWLIDDNIDHCVKALEEEITPILFGDYGWQYNAPYKLTRCRDWQSVLDYFENEQSAKV
ncbi:MAG: hypothetical protein M3Q79_04150 [bacterium]|nr:hypothetical protein [bacterium]